METLNIKMGNLRVDPERFIEFFEHETRARLERFFARVGGEKYKAHIRKISEQMIVQYKWLVSCSTEMEKDVCRHNIWSLHTALANYEAAVSHRVSSRIISICESSAFAALEAMSEAE